MAFRFLEGLPVEPFLVEHLTTAEGNYELPLSSHFPVLPPCASTQDESARS